MQPNHSAQLRYLPPAANSFYATPPNQQRYGLKRPRFEDDSIGFEEESSFGHHQMQQQQLQAPLVRHHLAFQIRHRSTDKTRGLRHFAHKVCEKVKEKGQTNYNEVADELVTEYFDQLVDVPQDPEKYQYDVRNIRRRVYDALNVLMAMNIIEKEKKEIRWVGLPTSSLAECRRLEEEKMQRQERIRQKTEQLQELIVQLVAYKSLVQRNRERERLQGRPPNSAILYLPYIIVSASKKTMVECAIAPDKTEYWFNFDSPFEIHDDIEVLKRLGLAYGIDRGEVEQQHVPHIKACLPPALRDYVDQILEGTLTKRKPTTNAAANTSQQRQPLVKVNPNARAIRGTDDSIVVKATRANLSGVAPAGDGGPMGSFLGPVTQQVKAQSQIVVPQQPMARYAVIPRPVSARYTSVATSLRGGAGHGQQQQQQPPQHQQQTQQLWQQPISGIASRLGGGMLHYEMPAHPMREQMLFDRTRGGGHYMEQQQEIVDYQVQAYLPADAEYIDAEGEEQIIEEVVTEEQI